VAVRLRTEAIETLVAVSQQAVVQVKQIKTSLIAKLKTQQVRLLRLHAEEGDGISPGAFREKRVRIQNEITAAEKSLAETEKRLRLDAAMLRMALELAEDVAAVYVASDEQTERGLNQAFFAELYITPEWDEGQKQTVVTITQAELTEPYAVLLADDLVSATMNEVKLIRAAATNAESGPCERLSHAPISIFFKLAEGEGFEPSSEENPLKRFSKPSANDARDCWV
jgi:hypothetical protein